MVMVAMGQPRWRCDYAVTTATLQDARHWIGRADWHRTAAESLRPALGTLTAQHSCLYAVPTGIGCVCLPSRSLSHLGSHLEPLAV